MGQVAELRQLAAFQAEGSFRIFSFKLSTRQAKRGDNLIEQLCLVVNTVELC
jgi:hypothetical protein